LLIKVLLQRRHQKRGSPPPPNDRRTSHGHENPADHTVHDDDQMSLGDDVGGGGPFILADHGDSGNVKVEVRVEREENSLAQDEDLDSMGLVAVVTSRLMKETGAPTLFEAVLTLARDIPIC
jgi:hypothetical protein